MSTLKIRKVGNSLGVIFPKEIQDTLNISEGDIIDVTSIGDNKVILDSHLPHHSKWKFKDTELNAEDKEWLNADLEDDDDKAPRW
ncbi:MAG TPA: AbrB/MazE/SpoVT family DNA-binding domain-containing protein [Pseudobdellovibrionaceae bacterium]|nr:AbrB/MazE/SpoVT family DNA-binding domain-containing protein [Pseudobdellovibrionaceae bacterium]